MNIPDEKIKQLQMALQDGAVKGSIECHEVALDLYYMYKSDLIDLGQGVMVPSSVKKLIDIYLEKDHFIKAIRELRISNDLSLVDAKVIMERYREIWRNTFPVERPIVVDNV